jgi:glycosyltransferase involved in cell wall biosynthesis
VVEPYEESQASGMGYSVIETAKALARGSGYELTLYSSRPLNRALIPGAYRNTLVPKSFVGKFLYFLLMKNEVDLMFYVVALLPLWIPKGIHAAVICKELPDHHLPVPGFLPKIKVFMRDQVLMPTCMRRSSMVLVSSKATAEDVQRFYHIPEERIQVIYEGYQDWHRYASQAPSINPKWKPFFFFTGKVKSRKNVHGIVSAFIAFKKRTQSPMQLVIAGSFGGGYYARMYAELKREELENDVRFLGYVSAPMMYALYMNACALVFPSLSEGFGMPVIEAMSLGLPVITSDIPSLSEIAGGAALLCDPSDIHSIAQAMERMANDVPLREELRAKGFKRAEHFSWEKVGQKYWDAIGILRFYEHS